MKIVVELFTILLMAISLVGCHPHMLAKVKSDMGPGPECPKDELAIIKGGGSVIFWGLVITESLAEISVVDGKGVQPNRYADEVRVIPGPHEVQIKISKRLVYPEMGRLISRGLGYPEKSAGFRFLIFSFDTKAGHTYGVDVPIYWRKDSIIKIIDEATKEAVASQVVN